MMTLRLLTFLFFFVAISDVSAQIWRVNNNPETKANFATLQAAHDGAAAGDTIHLEGSATSYGNLTCIKKLTIIGPGYFLDQNPDLQALELPAQINVIHFAAGSSGSSIMGVTASQVLISVSDIEVRRNRIIGMIYYNWGSSAPTSNIIISQNYALGIQPSGGIAATNILVRNNYFASGVTFAANAIAIIQNNIFGNTLSVFNSSVTNNIMVSGTFQANNNLVSNNIGNAEQFGISNGNKSNVAMSTVFVGAGENISTDGQWKLKAGSPAIGAGFGSTQLKPIDCGIFGGPMPYVLSGLPPVPTIYFFENQPIGSSTDAIDVTIKVKSVN
jgi:hypothetical protein